MRGEWERQTLNVKTHKVMVIASSGEIGGAPAKNLIFCISLYNSAPAQFHKCRKDAQERFIQKTNPQYSSSMSLTQPFYHSLDHRSGYPNTPLSLPTHFHSADITLCLSFPIQSQRYSCHSYQIWGAVHYSLQIIPIMGMVSMHRNTEAAMLMERSMETYYFPGK